MEEFSLIKPNLIQKIVVPNKTLIEKQLVKIPQDLIKSNLFIQLLGHDKKAHLMYYANSLNVEIIENYGQIKVCSKENKPLPKVQYISNL